VRVTKSDGSTLIEGDAYHVVMALAPGAYPAVMLDERSSVACLLLITGWGDFEVLLYTDGEPGGDDLNPEAHRTR
jgi:hypothetical protein